MSEKSKNFFFNFWNRCIILSYKTKSLFEIGSSQKTILRFRNTSPRPDQLIFLLHSFLLLPPGKP